MRSTEEEEAAAAVVAATAEEEKGSAKGGIGIGRTTRGLGAAEAVSGESGAGGGGDPPHAAEEVAVAVVSCSRDVAGTNPWIQRGMGFGFQYDAFRFMAKGRKNFRMKIMRVQEDTVWPPA